MQKYFDTFIDKLRVCTNCGHPFTLSSTMLCTYCYRWLQEDCSQAQKNVLITGRNLKVYSLFDWVPGSNNALSALVMALKGGEPQSAWHHYASLFLKMRMSFDCHLKKPILIPAPSFKPDHASQFCTLLSQLTGITMSPCLRRTDETEQKQNSLRQRSVSRIQLNENFTQMTANDHDIVFVDDVVTSGFTALSALDALNAQPQRFEIWSLAYRRKSCS
jgi:predicted amidophosphoribosyltransferase